jgi:hypothetical protein
MAVPLRSGIVAARIRGRDLGENPARCWQLAGGVCHLACTLTFLRDTTRFNLPKQAMEEIVTAIG